MSSVNQSDLISVTTQYKYTTYITFDSIIIIIKIIYLMLYV